MTGGAIFSCGDATGVRWQLGPLPPAKGALMLIGWRLRGAAVDGGVPQPVARMLARAMTTVGRVSFPIDESDANASFSAGPLKRRQGLRAVLGVVADVAATLRATRSAPTLVSSADPERVQRLFDDAAFPWHLQGQVALLSAAAAAAPGIDCATALSLVEDDWTSKAASLASAGVIAVLRPGVDGDVAAFWSLSATVADLWSACLADEARQAGIARECLSESDFMNALAGTDPAIEADHAPARRPLAPDSAR